jgi:hypothetical protein
VRRLVRILVLAGISTGIRMTTAVTNREAAAGVIADGLLVDDLPDVTRS